jgi:putative two-component system response regulator
VVRLPSSVGKRRVLLLDDEPLILRALKRALTMAGFEVTTTENGAEAREILQRERPDVVVSDLHMPHEDGARFLGDVAELRPETMRVLLSADLEFKPRLAKLDDARAHALVGKAEMPRLTELVVTMLEARFAEKPDDVVDLASRLARALSRPRHEDDAHRERVARLTETLAKSAGMSGDDVLDARLGATLHDVGQITIPERVFASDAPLSAADRALLERHPDAGAWLLGDIPALARAAAIVRAHHVRADGAGYPGALAAPPAARVLQVADAYDAIRCGRPYAPPRSHESTIAELERCAGAQLDADIVRTIASIGET